MSRKPYIPIGCDQQGRVRPTFLEQPQRHTRARRTSMSDIDMACAIEIHGDTSRSVRLFDAVLTVMLVAAVVGVVRGLL